jgi:hypothetical protein
MMPRDPHFKSWIRLKGAALQLMKAARSGVEFVVQVAEHTHKSYYDVKTYESERTAEDWYYTKTEIRPSGRKRLIKVDAGVITVLREQLGEKLV